MVPDRPIKDPLVLEFLDLKDEYSETDLEEALVHHLESFLWSLGTRSSRSTNTSIVTCGSRLPLIERPPPLRCGRNPISQYRFSAAC